MRFKYYSFCIVTNGNIQKAPNISPFTPTPYLPSSEVATPNNFDIFPPIFYIYKFCVYINIEKLAAAAAKSLQSCPTLCDPIDSSPPDSPIPGILQAWTLEWTAISFSNAWKWKVKVLTRVQLLATPWTAAYQAPSMGFSRQEYWSGGPLIGY